MKAAVLILKIVGVSSLLIGSLDPIEGSPLILAGSGLVWLSVHLKHDDIRLDREWLTFFLLISFGVIQLWELSAFGGFGGSSGHSMWWGILVLPYVVGWLAALVRLVSDAINWARDRHHVPDQSLL